MRGKVVDVVLRVEEDLLELVPVAARAHGGDMAGVRERIRREIVQRTALEAAVGVEHRQRLVFHRTRNVAAGRVGRHMVHEVVARLQHEVEQRVGQRLVVPVLARNRFGDVGEAARIHVALIDERGVGQRNAARVAYLDGIGDHARGRLHDEGAAGFRVGHERARRVCAAEVGGFRHDGIVQVGEGRVRVVGGDDFLRIILERLSVGLNRAAAARLRTPERAGHRADAAAGDTVEGAVEAEQRARVGIGGESARRREIFAIARAGGDAQ